MKYVLFVCTHNAGRSQIAQAFFEKYAPDDVRAESAGQEPAEAIWPNVVEAMREVGIDLSTKRLTTTRPSVRSCSHSPTAQHANASTPTAATSSPAARTDSC
jgi:protein-tyrosine-phosphatase